MLPVSKRKSLFFFKFCKKKKKLSEKLKNRQKTPNRHSFQKVFSGQQKSPKKHQIATSGSAEFKLYKLSMSMKQQLFNSNS